MSLLWPLNEFEKLQKNKNCNTHTVVYSQYLACILHLYVPQIQTKRSIIEKTATIGLLQSASPCKYPTWLYFTNQVYFIRQFKLPIFTSSSLIENVNWALKWMSISILCYLLCKQCFSRALTSTADTNTIHLIYIQP